MSDMAGGLCLWVPKSQSSSFRWLAPSLALGRLVPCRYLTTFMCIGPADLDADDIYTQQRAVCELEINDA